MSLRLSHSSASMYNSCSFKWHQHYQKKLREQVKSAALHFGDCLDRSVNAMLLDLKVGALKPVGVYESSFVSNWSVVKVIQIDGLEKPEDAKSTLGIGYAASDYDADLISKDDANLLNSLLGTSSDLDEIKAAYKLLEKTPRNRLNPADAAFVNAMNWCALKTKGLLMIAGYFETILPQIKEVLAVQKQVSLDDGEGNTVIGYVDAVLDFGNGPVICDLKTSSMHYDDDSASNSEQFALYRHCLRGEHDTKAVCFIVAYKHIQKSRVKTCSVCAHVAEEGSRHKTCNATKAKKRCDGVWDEVVNLSAKINMIPGTIDETFENFVVENMDNVLRGIELGIFTKNWSNCNAYNRKCAYYYVCRKGKDSALVEVK